jgi:hypothetical protein
MTAVAAPRRLPLDEYLGSAECTLPAAVSVLSRPVRDAVAVRDRFAQVDVLSPLPRTAKSLPAAVKLAAALPTADTVRKVLMNLEAALDAPLRPAEAKLITALFLSAVARKMGDDLHNYFAVLTSAFSGDGLGGSLGLAENAFSSPLVAIMAADRLARTCRFDPKPGDITQEVARVRRRLDQLVREIERCFEARDEIDEVLVRFADSETQARVAPDIAAALNDDTVPWD